MPKIVERNGPRIRILEEETGRELWNGRANSEPPEYIHYWEEGQRKSLRVDRSTDAELVQALEHLLNPTRA
jgi:hypothetical protein